MDVVVHQAVRETEPPVALHRLREEQEIDLPVALVDVDQLLPIAAGGDVVDGTRHIFTRASRHAPDRAPGARFAPGKGV
jgi:hypothetical protein